MEWGSKYWALFQLNNYSSIANFGLHKSESILYCFRGRQVALLGSRAKDREIETIFEIHGLAFRVLRVRVTEEKAAL